VLAKKQKSWEWEERVKEEREKGGKRNGRGHIGMGRRKRSRKGKKYLLVTCRPL
jgi:hypothetical protein